MDKKITQLTELTTPGNTDYIPIVDESGTPTTKKITFENLTAPIAYPWLGAWLTGTAYNENDCVSQNGNGYLCLVAHTSGTFATDLAAGKWSMFVQKGDTGATGATGATGPTNGAVNFAYGTDTTGPGGAADGTLYVTYIP